MSQLPASARLPKASRPASADVSPPVAFTAVLAAAAAEPGLRKGERTRRQVRAAVARCLVAETYAALSMDQISAEAGISRAAVYQYVPSKEDAVRDVLGEFQRSVLQIPRLAKSDTSPFDTILATNRYYINYFAQNAVLIERVREVRNVLPGLLAEKQRVNAEWAARVVSHARRHGKSSASVAVMQLRALALECMIDDVLREVFVIANPSFGKAASDLDGLARELSEIWYRALYM